LNRLNFLSRYWGDLLERSAGKSAGKPSRGRSPPMIGLPRNRGEGDPHGEYPCFVWRRSRFGIFWPHGIHDAGRDRGGEGDQKYRLRIICMRE
jgi:hypothetical protein